MLAATISGHVVLDPTGNGYRVSDLGQAGVTVKLYADTNHNGRLDSHDRLAAPAQVTDVNGAFSFAGLAPGRYFVSEAAPSGFVRTTPTTQSSETFDLAADQTVSDANFANFQKPSTSVVSNISFTVTTPAGVSTVVSNLRGNTQQGDTVTVNFTVAAGASPVTLSLVTYDAPGSSFDANTASQQVPIQIATGTFGPGPHSLTVQLPNNFYQVDFVLGSPIDQLGPAGSNIFYSAQGRLLSADNNGSQAPGATLSGFLFGSNNQPPAGSLTLVLTGVDASGNPVAPITGTLDTATGFYSFAGLQPGVTYTMTVTDSSNTYATLSIQAPLVVNGSSISGFDQILQPPLGPPIPIILG